MAETRPGAERKPPVAVVKSGDGVTVNVRGPVLLHGDNLNSAAPAALVVEKYTDEEYAKGEGKRKPFEISIDNEG